MAVVYLANDRKPERKVALKVIVGSRSTETMRNRMKLFSAAAPAFHYRRLRLSDLSAGTGADIGHTARVGSGPDVATDADCCFPAPPVLELDPEGNVLQAWGGPGEGYTWFDREHGIYIDHNGFVWLGTSNGFHVMKFTRDGKHVLTIGEPGVNKGSDDPTHLGGPANFFVEPSTNELFIADGYRNRRVVVFDAATGEYRRHWSAYGQPPDDTYRYEYPVRPDDPPQQYSTVHGIVGSKDGLVYVSDRRGNRIQVFRQNGEYLMERFVLPETRGSGTGFSLGLSRDPEQSLLYLIDGTNERVWMLRRSDLEILGRFGRPGRQAGEFIRAHMVVLDPWGYLYTGEAGNGRRMQRFKLKTTE